MVGVRSEDVLTGSVVDVHVLSIFSGILVSQSKDEWLEEEPFSGQNASLHQFLMAAEAATSDAQGKTSSALPSCCQAIKLTTLILYIRSSASILLYY